LYGFPVLSGQIDASGWKTALGGAYLPALGVFGLLVLRVCRAANSSPSKRPAQPFL
jgi:hypothetical protein